MKLLTHGAVFQIIPGQSSYCFFERCNFCFLVRCHLLLRVKLQLLVLWMSLTIKEWPQRTTTRIFTHQPMIPGFDRISMKRWIVEKAKWVPTCDGFLLWIYRNFFCDVLYRTSSALVTTKDSRIMQSLFHLLAKTYQGLIMMNSLEPSKNIINL